MPAKSQAPQNESDSSSDTSNTSFRMTGMMFFLVAWISTLVLSANRSYVYHSPSRKFFYENSLAYHETIFLKDATWPCGDIRKWKPYHYEVSDYTVTLEDGISDNEAPHFQSLSAAEQFLAQHGCK